MSNVLVTPKFVNIIINAFARSLLSKKMISISEPTHEIEININMHCFKVRNFVITIQATDASNSADPEKIANSYVLPLIVPR